MNIGADLDYRKHFSINNVYKWSGSLWGCWKFERNRGLHRGHWLPSGLRTKPFIDIKVVPMKQHLNLLDHLGIFIFTCEVEHFNNSYLWLCMYVMSGNHLAWDCCTLCPRSFRSFMLFALDWDETKVKHWILLKFPLAFVLVNYDYLAERVWLVPPAQ